MQYMVKKIDNKWQAILKGPMLGGYLADPECKIITSNNVSDLAFAEVIGDDDNLEVIESLEKKQEARQLEIGRETVARGAEWASFIVGYNRTIKNVTVPQVIATHQAFKDILALMKDGGLESAYSMIQTVPITGTIYSEEDREKILEYGQKMIASFNAWLNL